jgi:histidinol dehydrogenase
LTMFKQYDPQSAKKTILKRIALDETPVPENLQNAILRLFGEPLTPSQVVKNIIKDVRQRGDDALRAWTEKLDGVKLDSFDVPNEELHNALLELKPEIRQALDSAAMRIHRFHQSQPLHSWFTQALGGTLGQIVRPIQRIGLYVPAGSAPLPSSILMSAIPARVAGVAEIVLVTPPQRQSGKIAPIIMATASLLGIHEVYSLGGAQAIAALAYGTQSIRPVDKIFGPGNLFVSLAKRQVFGVVGVDSIAGPTETVVIADESANPIWLAADLLAQAEHDTLAAAILLTPSQALITRVQSEIDKQQKDRSRHEIIRESLQNRGGAVLTADLEEAAALANAYAPEHVCLSVHDPWLLSEKIYNAGGIFMGEHSFEVLGDYVAGPSHVMPTGGLARYTSPLSLLDFVHLVSLVALDAFTACHIADPAATLALAEGLDGHAYAARLRAEEDS